MTVNVLLRELHVLTRISLSKTSDRHSASGVLRRPDHPGATRAKHFRGAQLPERRRRVHVGQLGLPVRNK